MKVPGTPSCAAIVCPAECNTTASCGRFCGGGDCYTCSDGTWTRIVYSCIGMVCTGGETADAGTADQ